MKLDQFGNTVRLGIIGLGCRGMGQLEVLLDMPDVEISAVCDAYADRVERAQALVEKKRGTRPAGSTQPMECIDRLDVDAVVIMTSWETHASLAIAAMRAGKRLAMEVGGAASIEECWQLVRTSEETGVPLMFLENCCYGEAELTLLNMIRQNVFGTVVHCAGAYSHDLRDEIGNGDVNRHYRQRHFMRRNGELYPTHELGPIANYLDINRGNRMLTLTSMASKACGMHEWLAEHRAESELAKAAFNEGDVVITLIKCAGGQTIQLTHDCTLPRPYSRGGVIRGTKGLWMEDNRSIYLDGVSPKAHHWEPDAATMERYRHPLWKRYREAGVRGGHDGMDYLTLRAFVESVQNQTEPPIDVYDAAAWMCITPLSEQSIAMGSMPVAVPDFTSGHWCDARPKALEDTFEE